MLTYINQQFLVIYQTLPSSKSFHPFLFIMAVDLFKCSIKCPLIRATLMTLNPSYFKNDFINLVIYKINGHLQK